MLPLGDTRIDQFDQVQLLGQLIEGGDAAELDHAGAQRIGGGLLQAFEQGIGGTQILEDHWPRPAVHAPGFDEVVIGMAVDDSALQAGHIFVVYIAQFGAAEVPPQRLVYLERQQRKNPAK